MRREPREGGMKAFVVGVIVICSLFASRAAAQRGGGAGGHFGAAGTRVGAFPGLGPRDLGEAVVVHPVLGPRDLGEAVVVHPVLVQRFRWLPGMGLHRLRLPWMGRPGLRLCPTRRQSERIPAGYCFRPGTGGAAPAASTRPSRVARIQMVGFHVQSIAHCCSRRKLRLSAQSGANTNRWIPRPIHQRHSCSR